MTSTINTALMRLSRRAEMADPAKLVQTFVETGPVFNLLRSIDHQIMFGRRGTGKTHALYYLADGVAGRGGLPIYVDLRTIGSTGGLYADPTVPFAERATRLLLDVLEQLHERLVDFALARSYEGDEFAALFAGLDRLADEIANAVRVVGTVEAEQTTQSSGSSADSATVSATLSASPSVAASLGSSTTRSRSNALRILETGIAQHRVHFGAVSGILQSIAESVPADRIWLLLDEWSSIPIDLQPVLADLLKRALLPVRGVTVKIAAIEQRSSFRVVTDENQIGLELGADVAADLDLDDFLVFGNDAAKAEEFFRELLFRHVESFCEDEGLVDGVPASSEDLVQAGFTQRSAFSELVRAAEGVPRDAINIGNLSALVADNSTISVPMIRAAARRWYLRDKEPSASANPAARDLLHWIIDEVIGERRARAFLLEQGADSRDPLIQALYDARVVHVIKKGVASNDLPGHRFNVYALDFGCYVELITTAREPSGLFAIEEDDESVSYVQVPQDDYRSIRRAILDLREFEHRSAGE